MELILQNTTKNYMAGVNLKHRGHGGWGVYTIFDGEEYLWNGSEPETTKHRMELTAAIKALELVRIGSTLAIFTDSDYVRMGITQWIAGWRRRGWCKASGEPVANQDLWQELDCAEGGGRICSWVGGRHGEQGYEQGYERAYDLAWAAIDGVFFESAPLSG